ncbi:SMC family ATPase [Thermoleptolyngbya sp. C42_A2020_037]|uniref:AAA family ATPase n=1 Tax=Thermoleptolyngbya sp. C42_A2020_037 TaxID=2747799 RepID=UPI001A0FC938|nr:SMC family ATPase [Thermoleptolyngbya sp. C42_A2020_037]MBF2083618.1 SMC family ATPase [Thermoleptolyngbya sp. C42_A2020_037]
MQLLTLTLTNFKSHRDRHVVFQPGTNAICGENGAGKTSILEAIAWTLFAYQGPYRKEDLIRNGEKSAQARVAFISRQDGRTYEVERCTTKGYVIYDPQLGQKLPYRNLEAEVMPWLRQQLGVAGGTDLSQLFANTIGVPQGTFTADFLKATEDRKRVFDSILKVEEYKQANQKMLSLEKYAKSEVETLERDIARYEEALQDLEATQQRQQTVTQAIATAEATLIQLEADLATLQTEKEALAALANQLQQAELRLQTLTTQIAAQQQTNQVLETSVQKAEAALAQCEAHRASHAAYLQAEATLKQLNEQLKQRSPLVKQRDAQQKALAAGQAELTRLSLQLEALAQAQQQLQALQPGIAQQAELEAQQAAVAESLNQLQAMRVEERSLLSQQGKLQENLAELARDIQRLQALAENLADVSSLEQQRDRLQTQLSRLEAARQFEGELQTLLTGAEQQRDRHRAQAAAALDTLRQMQAGMPLLATDAVDAVLQALQEGIDLNSELLSNIRAILTDLAAQTDAEAIRKQIQQTKKAIDAAYRQRAEVDNLPAQQAQQQRLRGELQQAQSRLQQLQQSLQAETATKERRSHLIQALSDLGDPRGRSQLLQQDLAQQPTLQAQYERLKASQADAAAAIAQLDAQLAEFAELETQIDTQTAIRQQHQVGYQHFLQAQATAEPLPSLQQQLQAAIAQVATLEAERAQVQAELDELQQRYDPQRWHQVEADYSAKRSQADQISGGLPPQRQLLAELDRKLAELGAIAAQRDQAQHDLKQRKHNHKFITFARKTYKDAGPRITARYVQQVSQEGDRLFRELMNRPNLSLEWTAEYEILVREGGYTRRFINLSGGEQMCAALAVRLALLRVVADLDVAFFDEPTTNMDRPRRESLAEAIANLKSFRQLFVISHDDTFEKVTENVIQVTREV